ncbi:MAG: mandelate racemase/muconate lactonizing enzyme family protein [Candidatus Krumholzibacteriia bacterium]
MKIVSIASRTEQFPLTRPYAIAYKSLDAVTNVIVEIRTDDGRVGLGAASPSPFVTGETVAGCAAALAPARIDFLFGRDVRTLPVLCRELERQLPAAPAARAALDMALHDLLAQELGLPLVELLGRAHDALPTSVTIGLMGLDATLAEAREHLDHGFRCLKVKLGREVGEDIARVLRLREAIGRAATIRVDANQGWTRADLARFLRDTARADVELIEQPLPAADVDGLRAVPEPDRARLCADEALRTPADAWTLARPPGACGCFNIKLVKCGGIRPALRIAEIADLAGIALMWGCMDESVISIAAALHAALACPATRYLDLDGHLDLARDVAAGGFTIEDGMMRTTDRPGLGVTIAG